jgi:hypothetical protein
MDTRTHQFGARLIAVVSALAFAISVTLAAYVHAGSPYAAMALVTWLVAVAGWLLSSRYDIGAVPIAFNLYVGTLVALMALYAEEWYWQYPSTIVRYFPAAYPAGVGIGEHAFVAVFPLTATALMILGALAYYRRVALGELAAWSVFSWGCVASVAVYAVGPIAGQSQRYVGGMVAAPIVFGVALAGMLRLSRYQSKVTA